MAVCPNCGAENANTDKRCNQCGNTLPKKQKRIASIILLSICCIIYLIQIIHYYRWRVIVHFNIQEIFSSFLDWTIIFSLVVGLALLFSLIFSKGKKYRSITATAFLTLNSILFLSWLITIRSYMYIIEWLLAFDFLVSFILSILCFCFIVKETKSVCCPNCGAENPDKSKWCGKCGANLQSGNGLMIIRLIISVALMIAAFVICSLINDAWSWGEILLFPPYLLLLLVEIGFIAWNVISLVIDKHKTKLKPTQKNILHISLSFAIAVLIWIVGIGSQSNDWYQRETPEGQLVMQGISKENAESLLKDFEKFGLYDSSKVYAGRYQEVSLSISHTISARDILNGENPKNYGKYYDDNSEFYKIRAVDFTMYNEGFYTYYFKMDNGHIIELQNEGIYIVKDGELTENSLGKRYLLQAYHRQNSYLTSWLEDKYSRSWHDVEIEWDSEKEPVFNDEQASIILYGSMDGEKFTLTLEAYSDEELEDVPLYEDIVCKMSVDFD